MKKKLPEKPVYLALSLLLPLAIQFIALAWLKVTPFGDKTLMIADANGLYINYLAYVGRAVKGLEGFVYSFEKGLGGNMLPNIGITMLDPFFALFALFEIRDYPLAFTPVCLLNLSVCGLSMYLLLAELYGHKRSNLIFSTSYALIGFNVASVFQVFFFSGVQMLPLMALGLRRLLRDRSPLVYILALGYAILTSYYFGFMLCAASVLFFVLYLWLHAPELAGQKRRLFIQYALSSLCAGLLGCFVWLPSLLGISGGRLDQTSITQFTFNENMAFLEMGAKLFTGANNTDELVNGLPNLYVGILPLALVILFFLSKKTDSRKKRAAGVALGFYLLCFFIVAFNLVMHGGTVTNWFNYRYSFVFSFLLLLIAAEAWQHLDSYTFEDCKHCFFILLGFAVLVFSKRYGFVIGGAVVLDLGLLLMMFLAFRMHRRDKEKNPQRVFERVILLLCSFQLLLNFYSSTDKLLKEETWSPKVSEYQKTVDAVAPLVGGLKRGDSDFYRMEISPQRVGNCGNDPMLYGYDGVSHSGSYERDFVRAEIAKFGVHWFQTRNYYKSGISAATDDLLGIRYMIAQGDLREEKGYQKITDFEQLGFLKSAEVYDVYYNPDALPIAFLAGNVIDAVEVDYTDIFDNLNRTWATISGQEKPVLVEEDDIFFEAHQLFDGSVLHADEARAIVEKHDKEAKAEKEASDAASSSETAKNVPPEFSAYIEYGFTAKQDGAVYTYNRGMMTEVQGSSSPILEYLGTYHKGEAVKGYIPVSSDYVNRVGFEEIAGRFRAAYADADALHEASEAVRARPCTIEKIKDSQLRGSFVAEDAQVLLFTIPFDEGWTCLIDGEKAEIRQVLGVFMAVDAPAGAHSYEMRFVPKGLRAGCVASAAALLGTAALVVGERRRRKKGGPSQALRASSPRRGGSQGTEEPKDVEDVGPYKAPDG